MSDDKIEVAPIDLVEAYDDLEPMQVIDPNIFSIIINGDVLFSVESTESDQYEKLSSGDRQAMKDRRIAVAFECLRDGLKTPEIQARLEAAGLKLVEPERLGAKS